MKKTLVISVLAVVIVLMVPHIASAWGLPPTPPGCANIMEYFLTNGACVIR